MSKRGGKREGSKRILGQSEGISFLMADGRKSCSLAITSHYLPSHRITIHHHELPYISIEATVGLIFSFGVFYSFLFSFLFLFDLFYVYVCRVSLFIYFDVFLPCITMELFEFILFLFGWFRPISKSYYLVLLYIFSASLYNFFLLFIHFSFILLV